MEVSTAVFAVGRIDQRHQPPQAARPPIARLRLSIEKFSILVTLVYQLYTFTLYKRPPPTIVTTPAWHNCPRRLRVSLDASPCRRLLSWRRRLPATLGGLWQFDRSAAAAPRARLPSLPTGQQSEACTTKRPTHAWRTAGASSARAWWRTSSA